MNLRENYYSFLYSHVEYENILKTIKQKYNTNNLQNLNNISLVNLAEEFWY